MLDKFMIERCPIEATDEGHQSGHASEDKQDAEVREARGRLVRRRVELSLIGIQGGILWAISMTFQKEIINEVVNTFFPRRQTAIRRWFSISSSPLLMVSSAHRGRGSDLYVKFWRLSKPHVEGDHDSYHQRIGLQRPQSIPGVHSHPSQARSKSGLKGLATFHRLLHQSNQSHEHSIVVHREIAMNALARHSAWGGGRRTLAPGFRAHGYRIDDGIHFKVLFKTAKELIARDRFVLEIMEDLAVTG